MLQVRVHDDHIISGGIFQAGIHTGFFSEITGKRNVANAFVLLRQFPQLCQCSVTGAVIDKQQFKFGICMFFLNLLHHFLNFYVKKWQYFLFIITWYHN